MVIFFGGRGIEKTALFKAMADRLESVYGDLGEQPQKKEVLAFQFTFPFEKLVDELEVDNQWLRGYHAWKLAQYYVEHGKSIFAYGDESSRLQSLHKYIFGDFMDKEMREILKKPHIEELRDIAIVGQAVDKVKLARLESFVPVFARKQLKEDGMKEYVEQFVKWVLIDFPDVGVSLPQHISNDVYKFWNVYVKPNEGTNFILFTCDISTHQFFARFQRYELKPLTLDELKEAINLNVKKGTELFEPSTLNVLACLSGGNFRRFKRLVNEALQKLNPEGVPYNSLTGLRVHAPSPLELLSNSIRPEIESLFPTSAHNIGFIENIQYAIDYLAKEGRMSQQDIATEFFDGQAMNCSRALMKLEKAGIIERYYEAQKKIVKLKGVE